MITDLELKVEEAQTKTKHIIIVIINANNVQENINSDNQFYDCIYILYYKNALEK